MTHHVSFTSADAETLKALMSDGNAVLHPDAKKDLSLQRHNLMIGAMGARFVHHWTYAEYEGFLVAQRRPSHTWDDQQSYRRAEVAKRLSKGEFVPADVLAEDLDYFVSEAQRLVMAERSATRWVHDCHALQPQFERDMGYLKSYDQFYAALDTILSAALNRSIDLIRTPVTFGDWEVSLGVDPGRRPQNGYFGSHGGRDPALVVTGQHHSALGIASLRITLEERDDRLVKLVKKAQVDVEHVWALFGVDWAPPRKAIACVTNRLAA